MRLRHAAVLCAALLAVPLAAVPAVATDDAPRTVCTMDVKALPHISGMTTSLRHKNTLWVIDSAPDQPVLYAVDSGSCDIVARVTMASVPGRDVEAIASGRDAKGNPVLWVGDIGDNKDAYEFVRLYQVPEPKNLVDQTVPVRAWRLAYPDGAHNAETLLADPRKPRLWVVTKGLGTGTLLAVPELPKLELGEVWKDPLVLEQVGETDALVSDGAVSPDGSRFVLRDFTTANVFEGLPPGKALLPVELPTEPAGEAVTWGKDGMSLLVAGEKEGALWRVPLPAQAWTKTAQAAQAAISAGEDTTMKEDTGGESDSPVSFTTLIGVIVLGLLIVVGIAAARALRR